MHHRIFVTDEVDRDLNLPNLKKKRRKKLLFMFYSSLVPLKVPCQSCQSALNITRCYFVSKVL
jgi:hypothetical protein